MSETLDRACKGIIILFAILAIYITVTL